MSARGAPAMARGRQCLLQCRCKVPSIKLTEARLRQRTAPMSKLASFPRAVRLSLRRSQVCHPWPFLIYQGRLLNCLFWPPHMFALTNTHTGRQTCGIFILRLYILELSFPPKHDCFFFFSNASFCAVAKL